ncbi:MAG: hypothetical protein ACOCP4_04775, partial [Candidatus Woesearchaeota archaeon]
MEGKKIYLVCLVILILLALPFLPNSFNVSAAQSSSSNYKISTSDISSGESNSSSSNYSAGSIIGDFVGTLVSSSYKALTGFYHTVTSDEYPPVIDLISPLNSTKSNETSWTFNCSAEDDEGIENISIYLWDSSGSLVAENSTTNSVGNASIHLNHDFTNDGDYKWNCEAYDFSENLNQENDNYTFLIDTINPEIAYAPNSEDNNTRNAYRNNDAFVNLTSSDANEHYSFVDWNRSLKGWWRFEDGSLEDDSSYGNDGTNSGSTYTDAGRFGGAREFDGEDDYVGLDNGDTFLKNFNL